MEKDYYKILGITDEEKKLQGEDFKKVLNKKYKALALKLHPDRHVNDSKEEQKKAEEEFKLVTEANTVLSDQDSRRRYDSGGLDFDMSEFMKQHFGGSAGGFRSPFDSFFGGNFSDGSENIGENIRITVEISLEDVLHGKQVEVNYKKGVNCKHCNGTGSEDGKEHKCPHCNGTGRIRKQAQRGNMMMINEIPCYHCGGTGKEVTNKCHQCGGSGLEYVTVKELIEVPIGITDGINIKYKGLGSEAPGGGVNGDLIVSFSVKENDYFTRVDNLNIVHYEYVPFNECLVGFNKECKTIDGGTVYVSAPECTNDNKSFIFKGLGLPDINTGRRGDYAVIIKYIYPDKLTEKQREMLKNFNNN